MENLTRYSVITDKNPREIVLLRGNGCKWKRCTFCDYHLDFSLDDDSNFLLNRDVLSNVTGCFGKLEVINSGSFCDLDDNTMSEIIRVCTERSISEVHFECHFIHRKFVAPLRLRFASAGISLKMKIGVETFDTHMRQDILHKGVPSFDVSELAETFDECCLLFGLTGQTEKSMLFDVETGLNNFDRICINIMVENSTSVKPDKKVIGVFAEKIYPLVKDNDRVDILFDNTDFGVGGTEHV